MCAKHSKKYWPGNVLINMSLVLYNCNKQVLVKNNS